MIDCFKGKYYFLSNFYDAPVEFAGLHFLNNEAAFHAQKTVNEFERVRFTQLDPSKAKKLGRSIHLRDDWEQIKVNVMHEICRAKFLQNPDLARQLVATNNEILIEGNTWGDKFWGQCNGVGENNLGKILMQIRDELKLEFDAGKVRGDIVSWIRTFFDKNGQGCNAVVGISGGKDSSVVAALCAEALGKDRVIGVLMPDGTQHDIEDSIELVEHLGIPFLHVDIFDAVQGVLNNIDQVFIKQLDGSRKGREIEMSTQSGINLPPRIRMATLYAVAQSLNGRVANTCNLSEDWIGYSTRWGDSVGDFSPISSLTSSEVVAIGRACGLPDHLVCKVPSDGLCGKTDEDIFGFSYKVLDRYIRTGICEDVQIKEKIDRLHTKNLFKMKMMPSFQYKA